MEEKQQLEQQLAQLMDEWEQLSAELEAAT